MSRLGKTYLVDNVSRVIDYRLAWRKRHQEDIFGITQKSTIEFTRHKITMKTMSSITNIFSWLILF